MVVAHSMQNYKKIYIMRPRINRRVNIQEVILHLENKRKKYTEAINYIMSEELVSYVNAKYILSRRLKEKLIFKF
jgi:hypothetical protein